MIYSLICGQNWRSVHCIEKLLYKANEYAGFCNISENVKECQEARNEYADYTIAICSILYENIHTILSVVNTSSLHFLFHLMLQKMPPPQYRCVMFDSHKYISDHSRDNYHYDTKKQNIQTWNIGIIHSSKKTRMLAFACTERSSGSFFRLDLEKSKPLISEEWSICSIHTDRGAMSSHHFLSPSPLLFNRRYWKHGSARIARYTGPHSHPLGEYRQPLIVMVVTEPSLGEEHTSHQWHEKELNKKSDAYSRKRHVWGDLTGLSLNYGEGRC